MFLKVSLLASCVQYFFMMKRESILEKCFRSCRRNGLKLQDPIIWHVWRKRNNSAKNIFERRREKDLMYVLPLIRFPYSNWLWKNVVILVCHVFFDSEMCVSVCVCVWGCVSGCVGGCVVVRLAKRDECCFLQNWLNGNK